MSYYVDVYSADSDDNVIEFDSDIVFEPLEQLFYHNTQLSDIDYEFLKKFTTEKSNIEFNFQNYFKLTKETIEDWEFFKRDEWYFNYTREEHEYNCSVIDQLLKQNRSVYLHVY